MIIVYDQVKSKYQWFDETDPKSYIERWCQTQENSHGNFTAETLYLTAKTNQFVLVTPTHEDHAPAVFDRNKRNIQRNRSASKMYPSSALVWLVNRDFEIPKCLEHLLLDENEI